jgi:hypothetical protein
MADAPFLYRFGGVPGKGPALLFWKRSGQSSSVRRFIHRIESLSVSYYTTAGGKIKAVRGPFLSFRQKNFQRRPLPAPKLRQLFDREPPFLTVYFFSFAFGCAILKKIS